MKTIDEQIDDLIPRLLSDDVNLYDAKEILRAVLSEVASDQREAAILAAQRVIGVEGIAAQRLNSSVASAIRAAKAGE